MQFGAVHQHAARVSGTFIQGFGLGRELRHKTLDKVGREERSKLLGIGCAGRGLGGRRESRGKVLESVVEELKGQVLVLLFR